MSTAEVLERLFKLNEPKLLVFSPGPGHPDQAGSMNELIKILAGRVPMFGVCLGMQAFVSAFGGTVAGAKNVVHGKARLLTHDGTLIFKGIKDRIYVGRYHSLCATVLPDCMRTLAHSDDMIMAIAHKSKPIIGIQFHPESILSTEGSQMINNVISWAKEQPCS